jgi:hypothetical protein
VPKGSDPHRSASRPSGLAPAPLLRNIVGNPFRLLQVTMGSSEKLARAIYEEKAFGRLTILGDALEDAGCDSAGILNHCRQPGDLARGCWVIDLLLGKS